MEKKERRFLTSVYFQDIFAIPLARILIKNKIHPNVVTFFSLFFAVVSGLLYLDQIYWLGSLLFTVALILDSTDGRVARGTNTYSEFGAKLDAWSDKIRSIFVALMLLISLNIGIPTTLFLYAYYLFLPLLRPLVKNRLDLKQDPTVIFWDATIFSPWLKKHNLVGLYNGWERAILVIVIAPLTPYPIFVFVFAVLLEHILYILGIIFYLKAFKKV
jgi:hypothetical protein